MANVGTVTFDIAAEAAKLRSELDKVKKSVGSIHSTAKNLETGLKTVGGAIVGAFSIGAVTSFLRNVNQAADRLNDMSQRLGVSASRLNVLELAATQAGASTEAVSTAMAKLTENVGSAAAAAEGPAAKAIQTLGLSTQQLLKLRPDQAFEAVTAALSRMPNEFQRAAVAQDLLGKGAKELSQFYREGETAIDAAQAALERHNAVLSDLDIARIGIMNDDFAAQGTIIQNLGAKFLSNLSPAIGVVIEDVSDLTTELGGADKAGKSMGITLIRVVKALEVAANLLGATFEVVRSTIASIAAVAVTAIERILAMNVVVARVFGADDLAKQAAIERDAMSGLAESLKSIRLSAAENAQAMMTNVIQATADFMNAADLFEAKARALDERAKAAANRPIGGGGVLPTGGLSATSRILEQTALSGGGVGSNVRVEGPNEFEFDRLTQEIYDKNLQAMKNAGVLRQQEWEHQLNAMGVSLGNSIAYQTGLEAAKYETWGGLAGEFLGVIGSSNKKMAKLQQSMAIAQAIWWTASGVTNALRSVPFPANIAAAAKVAVMGALQIAKIRSARYSESGSVGGGGFGTLSGGGDGAGASEALSTPAAVTQQQPQRMAQVIIQGDVFSSQETVDYLIGKISEAINDRDVSFIASNSRQALDLGVGAG